MAFAEIKFLPVFGLPLIAWLGVVTITLFLITAAIGIMNRRGYHRIPFSWHIRMAYISITMAIIHGIVGLSAYI